MNLKCTVVRLNNVGHFYVDVFVYFAGLHGLATRGHQRADSMSLSGSVDGLKSCLCKDITDYLVEQSSPHSCTLYCCPLVVSD